MERIKLPRCPNGTRKNKKTGNCENKIDKIEKRTTTNIISNWISENKMENGISENKMENGISENKIVNGISENKIVNGISENKIVNGISENKIVNGISENKMENGISKNKMENGISENKLLNGISENKLLNKKTSRCPKGTLKNKKTGNCENKISNGIGENKISNGISINKKNLLIKDDWDILVTKKTEEYNGKTYTYLVIPKNTYVYRGFQHGDSRNEELFKKGRMTREDYEEEKIYDKEEYIRNLNGLFFGNLGVACYYAFNKDFGSKLNHTVIEYITLKPIYILDMSVWQNIKNVVDDLNLEDDYIFESTYGFDINNPTKSLNRNSGGEDSKMIEIMVRWMQLKTSPKINGFGHSKLPGLHSEFTCIKQNGFLKIVNEYNQNKLRVPELINITNPKDIILLNAVSFDTGQGNIYNIGENL
jgi:hypothetical protein